VEAAEHERLSDSAVELERLGRLLGDPGLEWLLARVRRRLELGQPLEGSVTLADASAAQRRAAQTLLGRRPRAGRTLSVPLPAVDEVLRRCGASPDGLAAAVIALTGPVVVRAEESAAERLAWEWAFAPLEEMVGQRAESRSEGSEELVGWLAQLRGSGVLKRLEPDAAKARELLERLATVLAALPADGEPLGRFAAHHAGGAHALDDGQPLATLALGAIRALCGRSPVAVQSPDSVESPTQSRRATWALAGVLCDELSSVVLTLGLPGEHLTGSGRILQVALETGEPVWLTLRQLVRDPPEWGAAVPGGLSGHTVYVCENPVVVELAADRLGSQCAPLVCTNGQPGVATMLLLRSLSAAGARLAHHSDFDWGGVRIANVLHARLPVVPWRFDAEAYIRATGTVTLSQPLSGISTSASWDPGLSETMCGVGLRIEEESVIEELLADLQA
jgi:uncharacterized protein (TIGR02679 family)